MGLWAATCSGPLSLSFSFSLFLSLCLSLSVAASQSEMLDQDLAPQHHRDGRDMSEVSAASLQSSALV